MASHVYFTIKATCCDPKDLKAVHVTKRSEKNELQMRSLTGNVCGMLH